MWLKKCILINVNTLMNFHSCIQFIKYIYKTLDTKKTFNTSLIVSVSIF